MAKSMFAYIHIMKEKKTLKFSVAICFENLGRIQAKIQQKNDKCQNGQLPTLTKCLTIVNHLLDIC